MFILYIYTVKQISQEVIWKLNVLIASITNSNYSVWSINDLLNEINSLDDTQGINIEEELTKFGEYLFSAKRATMIEWDEHNIYDADLQNYKWIK